MIDDSPSELRFGGRLCQEEIIPIGRLQLRTLSFADFDREVLSAIEQAETDQLCPLYGQIWPASMALCEYLEGSLEVLSFSGQRFLELGCGLALPSLLAAQLGAQVTATDAHPEVHEFVELHRCLNQISESNLEYRVFDFTGDPPTDSALEHGRWEYIIASDILYEPEAYLRLIQKLTTFSHDGTQIIIADPGRVGLDHFISLMTSSGFQVRHQTCKPNGCWVLVFRRNSRG